MSIESEFETVETDVENFFEGLPASVSALATKLKSDAGTMIQQAAAVSAKDITAGGVFNTASYVQAAKDIFAQVPSDAGILLSDVFAILNAEVSYILSPSSEAPAAE